MPPVEFALRLRRPLGAAPIDFARVLGPAASTTRDYELSIFRTFRDALAAR